MKRIKKVIISVIIMVMSLTVIAYAEAEIETTAPSIEEIKITDEFIEENKDFIVEAVDTAFASGSNFDAEIRDVLAKRFDNIKASGTTSQTEQDVLFDILWNIGNKKKEEDSEYKVLNLYVNSKEAQKEIISDTEPKEEGGVGATIAIVVLSVLLLGVIAVYALDKLIFNFGKEKSPKKRPQMREESEEVELYSKYMRLKSKFADMKKENETLKTENVKLSKFSQNSDEDCKALLEENEMLRNENKRLSVDNTRLQTSLLNANRTVEPQHFSEEVSEPEPEILKKSLIIEDGYIKIIEGDYVEVIYKENIVQAVPTERVLKASVRRALNNFFDFTGNGERSIKVEEPCVLEKDMQGYYRILKKGIVYLL